MDATSRVKQHLQATILQGAQCSAHPGRLQEISMPELIQMRSFHVTDDRAAELAVRKPRKEKEARILGSSTDFVTSQTPNSGKHPSGVTIYKDPKDLTVFDRLYAIIIRFSDIFVDKGFATVPDEELPRFDLKPGPVIPENHERRIIAHDAARQRYLVEFIGLRRQYMRWLTANQLGEDREALLREFAARQ
ncbi:hypothetical protein F4776DRAFT_343839 [Hypoxylon sp. NC0597]|nr:hypothetical protein F4776DRAFT_343839 [Hypoxylon sp. NC0597]